TRPMRADHSCHYVPRPEHHPPSRSNRVRRRVHDKPATQHRRSPGSRETGASSGGRNRAEQHPIPIHPLGAPWPPRTIQGKMLIAISESRRPRRNSVRYPVNAGLMLLSVPRGTDHPTSLKYKRNWEEKYVDEIRSSLSPLSFTDDEMDSLTTLASPGARRFPAVDCQP